MTGRSGRWRGTDHYDWLSAYLYARGIAVATRTMMSSISGSLALILATVLVLSGGPHRPISLTMTWTAFAIGVVGAVLWAVRWPTWKQSLIFGLATNCSIALACLAHPNSQAALMGCIAFATSGAYIAFFHGARVVAYNFVVAATVSVFEAVRLGMSGHPALAVLGLFLILEVNIATPLAIHTLVRALGIDLLSADRDPLTGLLNRRAFHRKLFGLVIARDEVDVYLMVALVDIDDFKSVNDRYGHAAGDQALVEVAQALRATVRESAAIARSGGEEFLIADISSIADPRPLAQRICTAIAALPTAITASVGTACAPLADLHDGAHIPLIDELVRAADSAMYHAKRNGGNRIHHHETS
jgi:diguanylate cyclase (GGDEF)-like protein